jgi:hypothetical protein
MTLDNEDTSKKITHVNYISNCHFISSILEIEKVV